MEFHATSIANGTAKLHHIGRAAVIHLELESIASELQKPIELLTQVGRLLYDRRFGWYAGAAEWCGKEVKINLSCADPADASSVLQVVSTLFSAQSKWNQRVQAYAVQKLLPLKNQTWLSEGEEQLNGAEFTSRMRLTSISIEPTGQFTFWHDDGGLFWGHSIQISGDVVSGPTRADIPG